MTPAGPRRMLAHRRTWREAMAQAEAKERLRGAIAIKGGGAGAMLLGLYLFISPRTWHTLDNVRVDIHGLRPFELPLLAIAGLCLIPSGLVVHLIGKRILRKRLEMISANPALSPSQHAESRSANSRSSRM